MIATEPAMSPASMACRSSCRITTIIAVRNAAATLADAIASHAGQRYDNKELVVVDGGSTDGTVDVLRAHDSVIASWISEPDRGIADAWNKGVARASGAWVTFLGADDTYADSRVLATVAPRLVTSQSLVVYGRARLVDAERRPQRDIGRGWDRQAFRGQGMVLCHQAVFQHRSLFATYGIFDHAAFPAIEYEWLLRYLKDHDAEFVADLVVANFSNSGLSHDPRMQPRIIAAYRAAQRRHGLTTAAWPFWWQYGKARIKSALAACLPEWLAQPLIGAGRALTRGVWRGKMG